MLAPSARLPSCLRLTRPLSFTVRVPGRRSYPLSTTRLRSMAQYSKKHKVAVVGSGNWGSAIAKIVAENTREHDDLFEPEVQMWVFEEKVTVPKDSKHYKAGSANSTQPQPLTKLINEYHENIKYLPNIALPDNLIANPSIEDSVKDATILVFNLPHQFIAKTCEQLQGKVLPFARGISCIKGLDVAEEGIQLYTDSIASKLGIYCGALSGANIANEVAAEKWSETTIAYAPPKQDCQQGSPTGSPPPSPKLSPQGVKLQPMPCDYPPLNHENVKALFHRQYFHVRVVDDVAGVSLGGALKNVVALAAGFVDGLGWGDNAKAAVMRVGLLEQVKFGQKFFPDSFRAETLTEESCGIADMITSCSGGRNFRCAKLSIERGVHIDEVEKTELNGQKLQGTHTASDVNNFLKRQKMEKEFPLFTAVHDILIGKAKPQDIPALLVGDARHGRPKM